MVCLDGAPDFPDPGRLWQLAERQREVGAFAFGRLCQSLQQVEREQRRVAGHGQQPGAAGLFEPGQEAGQRAGVVVAGIGPHRGAKRLIGRQIAVGIDQ